MATMPRNASRTAHLLALMGNAQPIYGRDARAAAMQQMLRIFTDMHVYRK